MGVKPVGSGKAGAPSVSIIIKSVLIGIAIVCVYTTFTFQKSHTNPTATAVATTSPQPVLYDTFYYGEVAENVTPENADYFVIYITPVVDGDEKTSALYKNIFGDKVPVIVSKSLLHNTYRPTYGIKFGNGSIQPGSIREELHGIAHIGPIKKGNVISYVSLKVPAQNGIATPILMMVSWQYRKK